MGYFFLRLFFLRSRREHKAGGNRTAKFLLGISPHLSIANEDELGQSFAVVLVSNCMSAPIFFRCRIVFQ